VSVMPRASGCSFIFFAVFLVMTGVDWCVLLPRLRQVFRRKNGGHRTNRHAQSTINASDWIDVCLGYLLESLFVPSRVNAIDWANIDAHRVLTARFCDHIWHKETRFATLVVNFGQHIVTRISLSAALADTIAAEKNHGHGWDATLIYFCNFPGGFVSQIFLDLKSSLGLKIFQVFQCIAGSQFKGSARIF